MRVSDPFSSPDRSHAVLGFCGFLVCLSSVVVAQTYMTGLLRQKKNHRRENGSEVGRKEVPSGDDKITS